LCGSQENLQRQKIREMMEDWDKRFPGRSESVFTALQNVVPSHLADNKLFDFSSLNLDTQVDEGDIVFDSPEMPMVGAFNIGQIS
jgi:tRNA 2-thiocytidine biosynthesis protein TtcA